MARVPAGNADKLSALIAEIEVEAYARGRADARKELLDLLGTGSTGRGAAPRTRAKPTKPAASKRRVSGRKRAPKGSVPRFVEQALRDRPGQTPQEILSRAANDMERLIKLPSIRTELRNGRQQGKYELNDGRWSLAPSAARHTETEQAPPAQAPQAAAPEEQVPQANTEAALTAASPGSGTDGGEGG
ncbi:MAG: hypothetical protein OXH92_07175 [Bryobacterales bacterium]|nr:hypothetical protein [Bryobacterales bacterium]